MRRHTKAYENNIALRISAKVNVEPGGCYTHSNRGGGQTYCPATLKISSKRNLWRCGGGHFPKAPPRPTRKNNILDATEAVLSTQISFLVTLVLKSATMSSHQRFSKLTTNSTVLLQLAYNSKCQLYKATLNISKSNGNSLTRVSNVTLLDRLDIVSSCSIHRCSMTLLCAKSSGTSLSTPVAQMDYFSLCYA